MKEIFRLRVNNPRACRDALIHSLAYFLNHEEEIKNKKDWLLSEKTAALADIFERKFEIVYLIQQIDKVRK